MREYLAGIQRIFLTSIKVLGTHLRTFWAWVITHSAWLDRCWPWFGRHRVIAISTLNSISIISIASLLAGVVLDSREAKAMARATHSGGIGTDVQARVSAPRESDHRARAVKKPQQAANASAQIGQRDYEVELRRPAQTQRTHAGAQRSEPAGGALRQGEDSAIDRSDDSASDNTQTHLE